MDKSDFTQNQSDVPNAPGIFIFCTLHDFLAQRYIYPPIKKSISLSAVPSAPKKKKKKLL
jgi:hypothetical protein